MSCPECGLPLLRGRWEIVKVLDARTGKISGWRGRWVPAEDLWCALRTIITPNGHGPFQVAEVPCPRV